MQPKKTDSKLTISQIAAHFLYPYNKIFLFEFSELLIFQLLLS